MTVIDTANNVLKQAPVVFPAVEDTNVLASGPMW